MFTIIIHEFYSSATINNEKTCGLNRSSINLQTVLAFREIGKGHEPLKTFNSCMIMLQPITAKSYLAMNDKLSNSNAEVAEECMIRAANEVKKDPISCGCRNRKRSCNY